MPVCTGCGGSFEDSFRFCPYCGKAKPEPPPTQAFRQEIPANACPICHQNDRVEKVTAIYAHGTHQISGTTTTTNTYVDKAGRTQHETHEDPFSGTQQSNLAARLAPPTQPQKARACFRYVLVLPALYGIAFGAMSITEKNVGFGPVIGTILLVVSCLLMYWIFSSAKRINRAGEKQHEAESIRWRKACSRWEQLYYCHRDDVVFIPGTGKSASAQSKDHFIYNE